jgi:hypothetical protein
MGRKLPGAPTGWGAWVGFRAAYLLAYHADRAMRRVMRVSVQASISAVQMSANSLKYVTSVFMGCSFHIVRDVDRKLGHLQPLYAAVNFVFGESRTSLCAAPGAGEVLSPSVAALAVAPQFVIQPCIASHRSLLHIREVGSLIISVVVTLYPAVQSSVKVGKRVAEPRSPIALSAILTTRRPC